MKRIYIFYIFLILVLSSNAQYYNPRDVLIPDVVGDTLEGSDALKSAYQNKYNDFNNWIPYCDQEKPLTNSPLKEIEVSFHVFLNNEGGNNVYTDDAHGKQKLIDLLEKVNEIYAGKYDPSDSVEGVVPLPGNDSKIRFTLGDDNQRIFFYENTSLNHDYRPSVFSSFIQDSFPSRAEKLNVFFAAGHYQARVTRDNIDIVNQGSGYTSEPTISFVPSSGNASARAVIENEKLVEIEILNQGRFYGFEPPEIEIDGGGGSGAEAEVTRLVGGADGRANLPDFNLSLNHFVVMLHSHDVNDVIAKFVLGHEFAHNLDLDHTYCGGGASAKCCSGFCSQGCTPDCDADEYLSDVFGLCPGTCPHIANWGNPYDNSIPNSEKITNNLMGGSRSQVYISPMQIGQMHRSLALKSPRKYVKNNTYSSVPLQVTEDEVWDFNLKLYRDVEVLTGAVLTVNDLFELPNLGKITVKDGGALVVTGDLILAKENSIVIEEGGTLKFDSESELYIANSGRIDVKSGGFFCVEPEATITLQDELSVINLRSGYNAGVNTSVLSDQGTCMSNPANASHNGNGSINANFSQDTYLQNETISSDKYLTGKNIYVGRAVTSSCPEGDVIIQNNSTVMFDAESEVVFEDGFEIQTGSCLEVVKE